MRYGTAQPSPLHLFQNDGGRVLHMRRQITQWKKLAIVMNKQVKKESLTDQKNMRKCAENANNHSNETLFHTLGCKTLSSKETTYGEESEGTAVGSIN